MLKLAWKNITSQPLNLLLNVILFALGVGLINFLFQVNDQLKQKFDNNLAGIDMVIGAKGSPLQMILCNMYHVDSPTGNINIDEAKPFLNPRHPLIKKAVPLSIGDSYKGYRIIGTDTSFISLYGGKLAKGELWSHTLDAAIGSAAAEKTGLKLGDKFYSSHGLVDDEDFAHDHAAFTVTGIFATSGSVLDQLILTSTKSVWDVHDHDEAATTNVTESEHDHDGHDHDEHEDEGDDHGGHAHDEHDHGDHHDHDHDHDHHDHGNHKEDATVNLLDHLDKSITSILIQFKNRTNFQALNMPRNINENTELQAASPAIEINRLYSMVGVGTKALQSLALLIALVSALSVFISLYSSLKNRKYEMALMRVMGAGPAALSTLIILEGLIIALVSYVIGILGSHIAMWLLSDALSEAYKYEFDPWKWNIKELYLLAGSLILGFVAAIIPAIRAYSTDIHNTLSKI